MPIILLLFSFNTTMRVFPSLQNSNEHVQLNFDLLEFVLLYQPSTVSTASTVKEVITNKARND